MASAGNAIARLTRRAVSRQQKIQIVVDFIERCAITISNKVDPVSRVRRKERLAKLESGYSEGDITEMDDCFKELVHVIKDNAQAGIFEDVLGRTFEECGLCDDGQDFTFMDVASLMSNLTIKDKIKWIEGRKFVDFYDGACGAGALLLAAAKELHDAGVLYPHKMVALACDVDRICVHMAYIQASLYAIPAVVVLGNTITEQEVERWYTPMYVAGEWVMRRPFAGNAQQDEALRRATVVHYDALRKTMELMGS